MSKLESVLPTVALLLGGFLATLTLTTYAPAGVAIWGEPDYIYAVFNNGAGAVALGLVVAVVVAVTSIRPRSMVAAIVAGAVLVGVSALWRPAEWVVVIPCVGAGLLLGGSAALAGARQSVFYVGAIAGVLLARPLAVLQQPDVPLRYADYLSEGEQPAVVMVPVLALLTAVVALVAGRWFARESVSVVERRWRSVFVGLALTVAGSVLQSLFLRSLYGFGDSMNSRWITGISVVPILVVAAIMLGARSGQALLVALAAVGAVSQISGADAFATPWLHVAVPAVAVIGGAYLGRRWPRPLVGVAVLAVVAASGLVQADWVSQVAGLLVFPAAVALAFVATIPVTAAASAIAVCVPVIITVPMVVEYGWTAYTPLTSMPPAPSPWLSVGVSVATVAAAGVGMALFRRASSVSAGPA